MLLEKKGGFSWQTLIIKGEVCNWENLREEIIIRVKRQREALIWMVREVSGDCWIISEKTAILIHGCL